MIDAAILLKHAEVLDDLGFYKESDNLVKIASSNTRIAQTDPMSQTSRLYLSWRPFAQYLFKNYGFDLFGFPKHLDIVLKAFKSGNMAIPGYVEEISRSKRFTNLFKDPRTMRGVEQFLQNYPQLSKEFGQLNNIIKAAKGQNYWQWLGSSKNTSEAVQEFKTMRQTISNGARLGKQLIQHGAGVITDFNLDARFIEHAKDFVDTSEGVKRFENGYKNVLLRQYGIDATNKTGQELMDLLASKNINHDRLKDLYRFRDNAQDALQQSGKLIPKATNEATEAAGKIASKFPQLGRFLGPLGIILSIPALAKWVQKINTEGWESFTAEDWADCVSDVLNFGAAVAFVIPGAQAIAGILGGISLALQAGKYAAGYLGKQMSPENPEDLKITGQIDKLSPEQKAEYDKEQYQVKQLIDAIQPGYGDFNTWLLQQTDISVKPQPKRYETDKFTFYDPKSIRLIDLLNKVSQWGKANGYVWLDNPQKASMNESFKLKLKEWWQLQKGSAQPIPAGA